MALSKDLIEWADDNDLHEPDVCHCDICQRFAPAALALEQPPPPTASDTHAELAALREENARLREGQVNTIPMPAALVADVLRELGELENHWKNEAESFNTVYEEAEHRMATENLAATRRVIKQVRAVVKVTK